MADSSEPLPEQFEMVIQSMADAHTALEELLHGAETAEHAFEAAAETALKELDAVDDFLDGIRASASADVEAVEHALSGLDAAADAALASIEQAEAALLSAWDTAEQQIAAGVAQGDEALALVQTDLEDFTQATVEHQQAHEDLWATAEEAGNMYVATLTAGSTELVGGLDEARVATQTYHTTLGGDLTQLRDTSVEAFDGGIGEAMSGLFDPGMSGLVDGSDLGLSELSALASAHGNSWGDAAVHALEDLAVHCSGTAAEELTSGVESLIKEGIEMLAEEITEQAVMMSLGAETTAAIAEALPEIVAAKLALATINGIIDIV